MDTMKTTLDYYKTLQLDQYATQDQIWLSYNRLVYLFRQGKLPGGYLDFLNIQQAYESLRNPWFRMQYDMWYFENIAKKMNQKKSALVAFFSGLFSSVVLAVCLMFTKWP